MPPTSLPEEDEFATFASGALQLNGPDGLKPDRLKGYQRELLAASVRDESNRPGIDITGTTFVVERREYANLYHTLIEIFNTFVASQLFADGRPFNLLLLDGHCQGGLDSLWGDILQPQRIQRLPDFPSDSIRFARLVLVPGGHHSPLFDLDRGASCRPGDLLATFIDQTLSAYAITSGDPGDPTLVWVDRRDCRPHPRSDGVTDRKVASLDQTIALLQQMYPRHRINVHGFEDLPFREQLRIVRETDVLAGVHGAALTHALFMRPGTELLEFRPRSHRRNPIFERLAALQSVHHRACHARTTEVLPGGQQIVAPTERSSGRLAGML